MDAHEWKYLVVLPLWVLLVSNTSAQVELVADVWPGPTTSHPVDPVILGNRLYFWADDGVSGPSLFATDGSTTEMIADMLPDISDGPPFLQRTLLGQLEDRLYFRFRRPPFTEGIYQLWSTDGSDTHLDSDVEARDNWVSSSVLGRKLFFAGDDGILGEELFYVENDAVALLKDIRPGPESSRPRCFTRIKDWVFFTATDDTDRQTVWVTDGENVWNVPESRSSCARPHEMIEYNGELYYAGYDDAQGLELWKTDGISATLLQDILPGPDGSLAKNWFKGLGKLFFVADDGVHGWELWSWDGSSLRLAIDLNPGPDSGFEHMTQGHQIEAAVYDGQLYFVGDDGASGLAMWSWDGGAPQQVTSACTTCYKDHPTYLTIIDDMFIFRNYDSIYGGELWIFRNGSATLLADIWPGISGSMPRDFMKFANAIYFIARDPEYGRELWRYTPTSTAIETSPRLVDDLTLVHDLTIYPNPTSRSTTFLYDLARPSFLTISIFDLTGRLIRDVFEGPRSAGIYSEEVVVATLPSGNYMVQITGSGKIVSSLFSVVH